LELVIDTDLHEAETRDQFKWALLDWTKNSHLHLDLDVSLVSLAAWKRNRTNLCYSCRATSQASATTPIRVLTGTSS